jgi:hypothetical protein
MYKPNDKTMEIHLETMNRFCNQHRIIKHYIEDLPSQAIHTRFNPENWSIHEIIAYLCRYQYIFMDRLGAIRSEIDPFFPAYRPDEDPVYQFTVARTTGALLHEIYRLRDDMKRMLTNFSASECSRVGTHAVLGRMNVCQWIEFFLLHESNQFYKIFKQAGIFWSHGHAHDGNVISMPLPWKEMDDMVG